MRKKILHISYILFFIFPMLTMGGGWYEQPDPMVTNAVNKVTMQDLEGELLFAAGDVGMILMTKDGGYSWEDISYPSTFENLNDICVYYGSPDTVLIAVGNNGTILRSIDFGFSWSLNDTMTNTDFLAVAYDYHLGIFVIGGYDSELYVSYDQGSS